MAFGRALLSSGVVRVECPIDYTEKGADPIEFNSMPMVQKVLGGGFQICEMTQNDRACINRSDRISGLATGCLARISFASGFAIG
jgi:hypothetical protein